MRISDWSSDVFSSDLVSAARASRSLASLLRMRVCTSFNDRSRCSTLALPMAACRSARARSEERRVGKGVSVRVDLGGRRIIKKKQQQQQHNRETTQDSTYH